MGLSRLSAITIATNNTEAVAIGPNEEGKFAGSICFGKDHEHHPLMPIVSTPYIYSTYEETMAEMNEQIRIITSNFS